MEPAQASASTARNARPGPGPGCLWERRPRVVSAAGGQADRGVLGRAPRSGTCHPYRPATSRNNSCGPLFHEHIFELPTAHFRSPARRHVRMLRCRSWFTWPDQNEAGKRPARLRKYTQPLPYPSSCAACRSCQPDLRGSGNPLCRSPLEQRHAQRPA
jgi:hypothetical protein